MTMRTRNKLVQGVGVNDADYEVYVYEVVNGKRKAVWTCPFYATWRDMLKRCYREKDLLKRPSYRGSEVCEEWLVFSVFRSWMVEQEWKDENGKKLQLDKDLLSGSNRGKLYSPNTCLFVSKALNNFLTYGKSDNSGTPVGAFRRKGCKTFGASVCNPFTGEREYLGAFATVQAAAEAYNGRKKELAAAYAEVVNDRRIKKILLDFEVKRSV